MGGIADPLFLLGYYFDTEGCQKSFQELGKKRYFWLFKLHHKYGII